MVNLIDTLKFWANLLAKIRAFFAARNILEVETPLLGKSTITDPNIQSIIARCHPPGSSKSQILYLQTSPEFAMKRLLAAGSGSIYQICKAFRDEESGRLHKPEFTMLEWYRIGFDHHDLMDEMDEFLGFVIDAKKAERLSYAEMFQKYLEINPHSASVLELQNCAAQNNLDVSFACDKSSDPDLWLNLLLTHLIEQHLGQNRPTFVYDYPKNQAALAKIRKDGEYFVAERFEVYINGIELANGFHELADADEQRTRFEKDLEKRREMNLSEIPLDEDFLAALKSGLPNCAGVALGVDRLCMIAKNLSDISLGLSKL